MQQQTEWFCHVEWVSSSWLTSPSFVGEEFEAEFSAVTAPTLSSSWILNRDEKDNGLEVELAFWRPRIAFIAARVLLYTSKVSSPRVEVSAGTFAVLFAGSLDTSGAVGGGSMTSSSNGKSSSRFSSHSWTNLVRDSVVKKGWRSASCVNGRRNSPPVLLSYFFKILTSPVEVDGMKIVSETYYHQHFANLCKMQKKKVSDWITLINLEIYIFSHNQKINKSHYNSRHI